MKTMKRYAATLLAAVLAAGALAACGASTDSSGSTASSDAASTAASSSSPAAEPAAGGLDEGGVTNAEGYPITSEPVTIKAAILYGSLRPDMDKTNVWGYVAEKTNITFEVEALKDSEKVDLMFASRDFPDLLMNVGIKGNQMTGAVEAGDFVEIEPLLQEYAPTWYRFMQENPLVYNASIATDGKLYSMPYIDFAPFDRNLRDQWIMMGSWLEELNLEVPKTIDEFTEALRAFQAAAGTGTIPADVIPYYYFFDSYVGGQFDIYSSFGVYTTSADYVFVDNGVVKDQSTNPDIKEPLKYLRSLYAEGLTPPEAFTDDWNTYISKISSDPAIVGSYHSYANRHLTAGTPVGALDSGNGKTPYIRSQAYTPGPANVAIITANNKYPVATTRFFEYVATDTDMLLTVSRGMQGVLWDYDSDGKAYQLFWEESPDKMTEHSMDLGLHNSFIALKDSNFYENVWNEISYEQVNSRGWAYNTVYKDCVMPNDMVYISGTLSPDDTNLLNQYKTDVTNYRKAMYADFITGQRDIDAEWDAFTAEMKNLGLDEMIALMQQGYDLMVK